MLKPLKSHLTIFQQEGYDPIRFLSWWFFHPFTYSITSKKPLVMTPKVKILINISTILFLFIAAFSLASGFYFLLFLTFLLFFLTPFVFLLLSWVLIIPYEKINRRLTINRIRGIIQKNNNLTTIGITGSYGKTSVKDFLYTILSGSQNTIKTPESYNTLFGIAKVVDFELISKTRMFICEMGAYVRGEISELCYTVSPKFAILTAIGIQHLERFKNLSNTTRAKFELIDNVERSHSLVNLDNKYISDNLKNAKYIDVLTYSLKNPKADFYISNYKLSKDGTKFTIKYLDKIINLEANLFGTSNLYNLTAAISMSLMLKIPIEVIKRQLKLIKPSPHRLEIKKINQAILIDNAFSSNEEGFTNILEDLKAMKGKKALITPGIIELGSRTAEIHMKLGEISSNIFDKFILVGESERTRNFEKGIDPKNRNKINYVNNAENLWPIIENLSDEYSWILLENDLPDNF